MRRYPAGTHVRGGLYVNPTTGRAVVVPREGGRLEGADSFYVRVPVPLPLALLLAPLAGALFVIFLPLIGLVLLAGLLCRKVWVATGMAEALSAFFAGTRGRPGWAFLLGGRRPRGERMQADRPAGSRPPVAESNRKGEE